MSVCLSVHIYDIILPLHLSQLYDVLDHKNHIFSERLSSGDDNARDKDVQTLIDIDIGIDIDKDKILCIFRSEYFSEFFFRSKDLSGLNIF